MDAMMVRSPYEGTLTPAPRRDVAPPRLDADAPEAPAEKPERWRTVGFAAFGALAAMGFASSVQATMKEMPSISATLTADRVSEWQQRLDALSFPAMHPAVATVASVVWAAGQSRVRSKMEPLHLHEHFGEPIDVEVGLRHGEGAPMVLILPGTFGDVDNVTMKALKHSVDAAGMNFAVLPNPFSGAWLEQAPRHLPGIMPNEAEVVYDTLYALKEKHPGYFDQVSVMGYSYGALLAVATLKHQTESGAPALINGSVVALSPPQDLSHSMEQLDGLSDDYGKAPSLLRQLSMFLRYRRAVRPPGLERLASTPLAGAHDPRVEVSVIDRGFSGKVGRVVSFIDDAWGFDRLPAHQGRPIPHNPHDAGPANRLRREHARAVREISFGDYEKNYLSTDSWFRKHHLTPRELAVESAYAATVAAASRAGVPIMTLTSEDDLILEKPRDVEALRDLQDRQLAGHAMRIFEHGGHAGVRMHAEVTEVAMDFLKGAGTEETR